MTLPSAAWDLNPRRGVQIPIGVCFFKVGPVRYSYRNSRTEIRTFGCTGIYVLWFLGLHLLGTFRSCAGIWHRVWRSVLATAGATAYPGLSSRRPLQHDS